jgi:phage terminase large subunit
MMRQFILGLLLAASGGAAPPGAVPRFEAATTPPPAPVATAYPHETDEQRAARMFDEWRADPVLFVREHFGVEPHAWQVEVLRALLTNPRIAMSACKGPGKSAVLAWSAWWILACHVDAQGYALSITGDNLKDNLWKELAYWHAKSPVLDAMFRVGKERIASKDPKHELTWYLSARSFSQDADATKQTNTVAGLHGPFPFILLDEAGDMPPGLVSAAKGIFYVAGQRPWLLVAGNPTTRDGALYWITAVDVAQWKVVPITGDPLDPKRSPNIDIEQAQRDIDTLGRDNPWVMVNILGQFPPQGANQLFDVNDIMAAQTRDLPFHTYSSDARVWGLDPARSERASADEAVLARSQGVLFRKMITWRGLDGPQLAGQVARLFDEAERNGEAPDAIFVDMDGVGASAYDHLKLLGFAAIVHGVNFGGSADDPKYADKRTEMWVRLEADLHSKPICLPNDPVLQAELMTPRLEWKQRNRRSCFCLETKDELKARGVRSPNRADACALTRFAPVAPGTWRGRQMATLGRHEHALTDYNPLERG